VVAGGADGAERVFELVGRKQRRHGRISMPS
jgi:hypothetical protein